MSIWRCLDFGFLAMTICTFIVACLTYFASMIRGNSPTPTFVAPIVIASLVGLETFIALSAS